MLYLASALIAALALAHSLLGERFVLRRVFRRSDLPKLFGTQELMQRTLRFAWHLTTLLGLGIAAVLALIARSSPPILLIRAIGWTLIASGLLPLLFTRARHFAWIVFFAAGALCLFWSASG